jgi:hypothetical protein
LKSPVEEKVRLSASIVWRALAKYYSERGVDAWRLDAIPHHITSGPFIGQAYARLAAAFLRGHAARLERAAPVYFVELGSGHGRFGYAFLKSLFATPLPAELEGLTIRYVMTDISLGNLESLRCHPRLQPFRQAGRLDFARFDAARDTSMTLLDSGELLELGAVKNPVLAIANYVFDSLPQDAFQTCDGALHESLISVTARGDGFNPDEPEALERLSVEFQTSLAEENYYPDGRWNAILSEYRRRLSDTAFLFPTGALRCVEHLLDLSGGRLMLISADKGYCADSALAAGSGVPFLTLHSRGCFSMKVDYQAIGRYFELRGGLARHPRYSKGALNISLMIAGDPAEDHREVLREYEDGLRTFGPEELDELETALLDAPSGLNAAQCMALLRLSRWHPQTLLRSLGALRPQLTALDANGRRELISAVESVWENFFPIQDGNDVAFLLGTLLLESGSHAEALPYLQHSVSEYGEESERCYHLALCLFHLRRHAEARQWVSRAMELDPYSDEAKSLSAALDMV